MSDRVDRLEAELAAALRPQSLPADLSERIAAELSPRQARRSWSDRLLIATMGAGSAAAAVIVGVLLVELSLARPPAGPPDVGAIIQHRGETPIAFARMDDANW
jgi:hypothetical protein